MLHLVSFEWKFCLNHILLFTVNVVCIKFSFCFISLQHKHLKYWWTEIEKRDWVFLPVDSRKIHYTVKFLYVFISFKNMLRVTSFFNLSFSFASRSMYLSKILFYWMKNKFVNTSMPSTLIQLHSKDCFTKDFF